MNLRLPNYSVISLKMLYIRELGIKTNEDSHENYDLKNLVEVAIKKFEQHQSINLINKNVTNNASFHFSLTEHETILKEIINLDNKNVELLKSFLL